jgi:hypothetical protein
MMHRQALLFLGAALLATAAVAGEGVMFAHRFEADSSQRYRVRFDSSLDMAGMEITSVVDMEATVKCLAVVDGKSAMVMTFDKMEMSQMIMGKMESSPMSAMVEGKSVNFSVDAHGEVSEITPAAGFDAWAEVRMLVEPILQGWYVYLPATEVAVGGEWQRENRKVTSGSGEEVISNEYFKFKEMRKEKGRECAVVEQTADETVGGARPTPMGTFALSGAGKAKFEFLYDPASGRVVRIKGATDLDIDMTPESGGDAVKTAVSNHVERELLE